MEETVSNDNNESTSTPNEDASHDKTFPPPSYDVATSLPTIHEPTDNSTSTVSHNQDFENHMYPPSYAAHLTCEQKENSKGATLVSHFI